jgi:cytochrome P450
MTDTQAAAGPAPDLRITHDGPGGCPVLHGFEPLEPAQIADPSEVLAFSRREVPVFFNPELSAYIVTRHADVARVLMDQQTFTQIPFINRPMPEELRELLPDGFATDALAPFQDPTTHPRVRKLAQVPFMRRNALGATDLCRRVADETVAEFQASGEADLIPAYARKIPMRLMCSILGIDRAHEDDLHRWVAECMRVFGDPTVTDDELVELGREQAAFRRFALDVIDDRRRNPRGQGDFLTDLITATVDGEQALTDNEVFGVVLLSIIAGGDTTVNLIAQMVARMLGDGGALWRAADADRTMLDTMIEEELRYDHVGRLTYRKVLLDTEIDGVAIPKDSLLAVHIWSTGRDESVWEGAERYDPRRRDALKHLGFGKGSHSCMGAMLARVETRQAIEALLDQLPGARRVPGHEVQRMWGTAVQSVVSGLVVAWDVPVPAGANA